MRKPHHTHMYGWFRVEYLFISMISWYSLEYWRREWEPPIAWEVLLVVDKISAKGSMASRSRHLWMPYTMTRVGFQIGGTLTRKVAWRAHPIFKPLFEKSWPSLNFMLYLKPTRSFTFIKLLTGMQTNRPSLPKEVYLPCHSNLQFRNKRLPLCNREVSSCPYLPYLQSTLAWKVETTAEIIPSVG